MGEILEQNIWNGFSGKVCGEIFRRIACMKDLFGNSFRGFRGIDYGNHLPSLYSGDSIEKSRGEN